MTHTAGALASGLMVIGNGAADLKVSGVAVDASNNVTAVNSLAVTGGAGNLGLFTGGAATGTNDIFKITDTTNNTGTAYLLDLVTATSSAANGLKINCGATSAASRTLSVQNNSVEKASIDCNGNITGQQFNFQSLILTSSAAPGTPAATQDNVYYDSTDLRFHDKNESGTTGTTVVKDTGAANNFLTAIGANGVISKAQPAFSNLSGSVAAGQMPALTGDVTMTAGQTATVVANISTAATAAGTIVHTNIAAPSSPAAGKDSLYTDSTDLRLHDKNASGVIGTTVVADTGASNNFLTAIAANGAISKAQPAFSNLSGSVAAGQMPALTGDITSSAGTVATALSTTGASAASCGDATHSCSLTVDLKGRITANSNNVITAGAVSIDQLNAAAASKTFADGNFLLTFNNAQTADSQNAVTFGETTAATSGTLTNGLANQAELKSSTSSASTASPFSIIQGSITSTTAFPALQIQTTWNNASLVGEGIIFNVTDTASNASSLLLDLRKGNTTQFKIDKTGNATMTSMATNSATAGGFVFTAGPDNSNVSNSAIFQGGTSVTAYRETIPIAAPVNNFSTMLFSNATPGVGTWAKMSQTAFLTSAYTNATTTFSNVTGLSFAVEANTNYKLQCDLDYQTSATTADVKIQWTGPASPTFLTYDLVAYITTSTLSDGANPATATTTGAFSTSLAAAGTPTITTNFPLKTTMTLINGVNAGTVQLQGAATGTGTITILPGSCELQ